MCIISDRVRFFHSHYSHRILYAGHRLALLKFLQGKLADCVVLRCPDGSQAKLFIERINYSLLLFDEELPDATGQELARFVRTLAHGERTPTIIVKKSDNCELLARTIRRLLTPLQ